jgi:hypothetical protein
MIYIIFSHLYPFLPQLILINIILDINKLFYIFEPQWEELEQKQ